MACTVKFRNKTLGKRSIEDYLDKVKNDLDNKAFSNKTEYTEHRRIANILSAQKANDAQKFVAHKLVSLNSMVDGTDERFYAVGEKKFIRSTNLINTLENFEFKGEDDGTFEKNRQWGNQINLILDNAIEDKGLEGVDFSYINKDQAQRAYDYFKKYNFGENVVVLTQVKLYQETTLPDGSRVKDKEGNEYDGVAGVADIVVIDEKGNIQVLDLKSSITETTAPYTKVKNGISYTNSYDKGFGNNPSKKQRHAAQLTIYHNMLKSFGFSMNKRNPIGVLPVHIKTTSGNTATELVFEPLIDNHQLNNSFAYLDNYGVDEKLMSLMEKIRLNLGRRKDKAESENANQYFINGMIEMLNNVNDVEGIERFVKDMYDTIIGNEKTGWEGLAKKSKRIIGDYRNNPDKIGFLNDIQEIRDQIEIIKGDDILKNLKVVAREYKDLFGNYEEGSILSKLHIISDAVEDVDVMFEKEIPDAIAEILSEQVPQESLDIITNRIKQKEESLQKMIQRGASDKKIEKFQKEIEEEKLRYAIDSTGKPDIKQMIKHEIQEGGYKDISFIDKLLTPAASAPVGFLSTFALTIKNAITKIRQDLISISREAEKVLNEFTGGRSLLNIPPEELYKKFISSMEIMGKKVAVFKGMINYDKYMQEKNAAKNSGVDMKAWYEDNTEERPEEDVVIEGVMFIEGKNSIKKRMKKQMSKKSYDIWLSNNPIAFKMPKLSKYKQEGFDEIKNNKMYLFLLKTYFDAQKLQPKRNNDYERFIIPFMEKKSIDRVRENLLRNKDVKGYLKYQINDIFSMTEEDKNTMNYSEYKSIPQIFYNSNNIVEYDLVSKDVLLSVLKYYAAAKRYNIMSRYKSLGDNLLAYVNKTTPAIEDGEGFKMLSKAAKFVGLEKTYKDYKSKTSNNAAAVLEMYIDVMIYGRKRVNESTKIKILGKQIDFGKVADTLMGLASFTQIGLNLIVPISNSLQGNMSNIIESSAKSVFSTKSWLKAKKEYYKYSRSMGIDLMQKRPTSKIGLMVERYDPIQGVFYDNFGNKITTSLVSKTFNKSMAFALQNLGEHQIQVQAMIAQMLDTKVTLQDGTETNMYDALEVVDGELQFKEGVIEPNEIAFINKMHANNKRLHGIYSDQDPIMAGRYTIGRIMLFYRKFLAPGWKKRWKKEGFDYELGDFTEGTYRVFFDKLFNETQELFNYLFTNKDTTLSPLEKENVRRALTDQMIILFTGVLVMALTKIKDEEDDEQAKWAYGVILYFSMRLNAELSVYGVPTDPRHPFIPDVPNIMSPVRNVTALDTILMKAFRAYRYIIQDGMNLISGEDIERYKVDTAHFDKGTSKSYAAILKLFGMGTRSIVEIDAAIDQLIRMREQ